MALNAIHELYRLLDRLDAARFADRCHEEAVLLIGNQPPLCGRVEIFEGLASFFAELHGIHHEIHDVWRVDNPRADVWVAHANAWFRVRGCREPIFVRGAMVVRFDGGDVASGRLLYDLTPVCRAIEHPGRVFEAIDESFPASDAPSWTP